VSQKPTLIYDGNCSFCKRWVDYAQKKSGDAVTYKPSKKAEKTVIYVDESKTYTGAAAVFQLWATWSWMGKIAVWKTEKVPGFSWITEKAYTFVANNRHFLSHSPASFIWTKWLGIIYLIAFASLLVQVKGLYGSEGILPVTHYLKFVKSVPTIFWLGTSDLALVLACWVGIGAAVCLIGGLVPALATVVLWGLYVSFLNVGQAFLSFQWDILLVEVGFLSIWMMPLKWRVTRENWRFDHRLLVWAFRWVVFRLMFGSGVVKVLSGDASWANLTALNVHYLTQPLPHGLSWYIHQMPVWFHKLSTAMMFFIELVVPFFIFMGVRMRRVAAVFIFGLMGVVFFTGNYGYFNLLVMGMCWSCLKPPPPSGHLPLDKGRGILRLIVGGVILGVMGLGLSLEIQRLRPQWKQPQWVYSVRKMVRPFHLVGRYGLFSVMTTKRYELEKAQAPSPQE